MPRRGYLAAFPRRKRDWTELSAHQENASLAIWWVWREFPPTWPLLDQIALIALIALLWIPPPNCLQLAGNLDYFARNLPHIPDQLLLVSLTRPFNYNKNVALECV
jgi:hypothetical protein